jgi:TIR domain
VASKRTYDIFLSYARVDDADGQITRLGQEMREIFRRRTGKKLRVFQDRPEIQTSETWQPRIQNALNSSSLLVPVISRAYFGSDWCHREWYHFAAAERGVASEHGSRLIYPLFVDGLPSVSAGTAAQSWLDDVSSRQAVDLGGTAPGAFQHDSQVQLFMDSIMAKLHRLNARGLIAGQPTDREHINVFSGYVGEGERFIQLLSEALSATIVGITNETLAEALSRALAEKRRSSGRPDAFWDSLRIVFLSENLLDSLNDVLAEYPDQSEAILQRRLAAEYGMRAIRILLEQVFSYYWELYESPFYLPFAGTLFEMPDGRRTVQLLLRRPQRRTPNQMYLEFDVKPDQYIAGAFEDIVQISNPLRYIIPVGWPRETGEFRCTSKRFREHVLRDDSGGLGWLPVVVIVTWQRNNDRPALWLQLRTRANAHREVGRLAHLTNYVFQNDVIAANEATLLEGVNFDLPEPVRVEAAKRCFRADIGDYPPEGLFAQGTSEYIYPDKENLYFYVFTAVLPQYPHFIKQAEMRSISVVSLLHIRETQALRNAIRVCRLARRHGAVTDRDAEIAALNLQLHDHSDLAEQVLASVRSPTKLDAAARRIELLEEQTGRLRQADGEVIQAIGLAGLLYREFFTTFLPVYEKLSLPGASDILTAVREDPAKKGALERLARIYRDEALMSDTSNIEQ